MGCNLLFFTLSVVNVNDTFLEDNDENISSFFNCAIAYDVTSCIILGEEGD